MTPLPDVLVERVQDLAGPLTDAQAVGGGCIANATRIEAGGASYFLKWSGGDAGLTFEAEAAGLRALRAAGSPLFVPDVLAVENAEPPRPGFLLMDWITPGPKRSRFWSDFGASLAALHRHVSEDGCYGFGRDNFIGRLHQYNGWEERWPDFFRRNRLNPQIEWAREAGRWKQSWTEPADRLLARLDDLLPASPPASILHGDLWSGNFLVTEDGRAALIDPAAYYGHRETDLALTELFGGFDARFYDAYRAAWALEPGYAERREVYNLYHLLNHLNHFGGSYAAGVERTLKRFS